MIATFVVRLVADNLREGQFVGEVEHVASGRTATVRDADELARFAQQFSARDDQGGR